MRYRLDIGGEPHPVAPTVRHGAALPPVRRTLLALLSVAVLVLSVVATALPARAQTVSGAHFGQLPEARTTIAGGQAVPSFSPDGQWLVVGSDPYVQPGATVDLIPVAPDGSVPASPAFSLPRPTASLPQALFSPSGDYVAVTDAAAHTVSMVAVGPGGGTLEPVPGATFPIPNASPFVPGYQMAFSPDGAYLALTDHRNAAVWVYAVAGSQLTLVSTGAIATLNPAGIAFSPDGSLLAIGRDDSTVLVFPVGAGGTLGAPVATPVATPGVGVRGIAFRPTGSTLAVTDGQGLFTYSVAGTGQLSPLAAIPAIEGFIPSNSGIDFNQDASLLLVSSASANAVAIYEVADAGATLTPVDGSPFVIPSPAPFSDGIRSFTFSPVSNVMAGGSSNLPIVHTLSPLPVATIVTPDDAQTFQRGQSVPTSFACADLYGPGIASCVDSEGASGTAGQLDTSSAGQHTYSVTATDLNGLTSTATITYTVQAIEHTVVFDANGGTGTMPAQTAAEPTPLTPNAFTRDGFTFTGWNTAPDGTGTAYADEDPYAFDADVTLFAQWEQEATPPPTPPPTTPGPTPPPGPPGSGPGGAGPDVDAGGSLGDSGAHVWPLLGLGMLAALAGAGMLVAGLRRRRT